ncbi:pyridoxamine 5'-phosphate oxidase family protein [Streptomyces sp. Li-HN-5-11]|uniref:pyridoxamine 5'-phosphate oxidase family protein n=1 Tax=Streptomyces sp. Li-HN-5-11 TaxID=3075432 RepID=UPI0028A90311|nr:pyridoxamine 5'-phosphate oxidase family protein [Streptomyces sp. Li-HN-5-11]WNM31245.1 pyridoxamine 5'-phosphate oxidase family protein [Streptomyces sp. Li-HN-5-11]
MSASPSPLRMLDLSGAEALWLLEGDSLGRLLYVLRGKPVIRPGRHVFEYGRLVVRTPAPTLAMPETVTYCVDEIQEATGIGWTVTVAGPAEVIRDRDEVAHCRRTLAGWVHGPHDAVLRIHPKTVTGFRLAHPEV